MTEKKLRAIIGKNILKERAIHNMPIDELAARMGKSGEYLTSVERGDENLSQDSLLKLANIFGIPVDELFTEVKTVAQAQLKADRLREALRSLIDDGSMKKEELCVIIMLIKKYRSMRTDRVEGQFEGSFEDHFGGVFDKMFDEMLGDMFKDTFKELRDELFNPRVKSKTKSKAKSKTRPKTKSKTKPKKPNR